MCERRPVSCHPGRHSLRNWSHSSDVTCLTTSCGSLSRLESVGWGLNGDTHQFRQGRTSLDLVQLLDEMYGPVFCVGLANGIKETVPAHEGFTYK